MRKQLLPFCLDRIDNRYAFMSAKYKEKSRKLRRKPSEYFITNFSVTSSGQNWSPAVRFCQEVLGAENVLFAADYPFEDQNEAVKLAAEIPMSDEHREVFFEENATRVFGLKN